MRRHGDSDRSHSHDAHEGAPTVEPAAPLLELQRTAGNAAVTQFVQRLAAPEDAPTASMSEQLARRLREAMAGWGTDEDAIYGVFSGRTQQQVDEIEAAYSRLFSRDLNVDLDDELNARELRHLASLAPSGPAPAPPSEADNVHGVAGPAMESTPELDAMVDRMNRAEIAARQLRAAMAGLGTDEDAIFAVLTGRSAAEREEIDHAYLVNYRRSLETDLRDEMSGRELTEALRLLNAGELSAADELYQAMAGLGTDEARITRILENLGGDQGRIRRLITEYTARYGSLLVALDDDLSGAELIEARRLLGRVGHATACREVLAGADPDLVHQVPDFGFLSVPDRLQLVARVHTETIVGDNDEGVLERIWLASDMAEPAAQNQALYNESRDRGAEIPRTLTTFGRFENRFEQDMFEGGTTVGQGLFDWTLVGNQLEVKVPINFRPADGVTPPYALWQTQIDNVWNQYAVDEPEGGKILINFTMINSSNASRTVKVVENETPGVIGPKDRANAGKFFMKMRPSTVPHEFGHFIGLPDEYQRSHDDFVEITGTDKVGPANASGQTEADIADDLHDALHLDAQPTRRVDVKSLLTTVGLIVGGIPQQGDFAQEVMTQYNERHGTLKTDLIRQLDTDADRIDRWLFQTVFSYASSTIMGNPSMFGAPPPHSHPVEPRHLREFVSIVQSRHPGKAWTAGPR